MTARQRLPNRRSSETFDLESTFGNRSDREGNADESDSTDTINMVTNGGNSEQFEPPFKLVPFDKISLGAEPRYLVKGLIPRSGLVVLWGPPKCGKSFLAFDLAMHVALGWAYRDRRVQQGAVVYCAFEGGDGFKGQTEAFRIKHLAEDHEPVDFHLLATRANLATDHAELIQAIHLHLPNRHPVLVVLDTLNRSLQGSESNDQDMAAYVQAADAIRDVFDCAVVIVHHCGVDGSRPRGHTSLMGAADAQLAVKRNASNNVILTVEWMKDGPEGDVTASRLERAVVGTDADGEEIDSCIVLRVEIKQGTEASAPRLTKNQQTMFGILYESGERGLTTELWHERTREAGIGTRRKGDLFDIRKALLAKRLIRQTADGWAVNHQSP
jgi:hypothetical protein